MQEKIITAFKAEFDKITNQKTQKYAHKIFFPAIMTSQPCFIVTDKIFYAPAPANILTTDDFNVDLPYICGVLNSKLIYYAMREWYMGGGISGELKVNNLFKVPIPKRGDLKFHLCL